MYRLQNTYKFDGDNNPNYERDLKPKRGRRPKEMDASEIVPAQTAQVLRLQGLLKVKNKNGNLEYWVCFSQWTWREVSEDFYNLLKK